MIRRKNPTDHDLISKLEVKKAFPPYGVKYEVYLGKRRIGFADIDRGKTEISFVNINEEYRRKGVSSFLYDYIENDVGYKLKPSLDLLEDGEAFWKSRNKKNNPRDEEFLNQLKIEKRELLNRIRYNIYYLDEFIAWANYSKVYNHVTDIYIYDDKYKRKGLATYFYDYVEKDQNVKLRPSPVLLEEGELFWQNRLKKTLNPTPKNARTLKTSKTKIPR
jgi:hypothetical protein